MTNQEAIRLMRNLPTMCEFTDAYGEPIDSDAYYEAVDMAISALQAQETINRRNKSVQNVNIDDSVTRKEVKELSKNSAELDKENGDLQSTCDQLAIDCISRQAAIDTEGLEEEIRCEMCRNQMKTNRGCDGNCKYDEKLYEKITQILDKRITPLLSAQHESNWIPVSERLPDDLGDYLVSIKRIGWNMEEYVENDIAYWDDMEGFHKADEVLAWMPLPEPYRAERRTDE